MATVVHKITSQAKQLGMRKISKTEAKIDLVFFIIFFFDRQLFFGLI